MAKKYEAPVIGIDLGTTYSCVAVWQEEKDRVEIIHNDQGNKTTPFVAFTNTQRLIGDAAKNQASSNPTNTLFDAKRLIGRKFSDPVVQNDMLLWPFKVIAGDNDIDAIHQGTDFCSSITRSKFEQLNMDLFEKCMETVEKCLTDAKMDKSSVDDIVLVGGSSRIPKVKQLLQDFFNGKDPCKSINPDEAVAYGAALQAALLCEDISTVPNLVLRDVTPLSLGTSIGEDSLMDVVIPRNTSIPVKNETVYVTTIDNQSLVEIDVYEGERTRVSDNNLLGLFYLEVPLAPKGFPIKVSFAIDADGILNVSAEEETSGNKDDITITNEKGRLSAKEIERMIKEAENFKEEDMMFKKKVKAKNALNEYLYEMRKVMKDNRVTSMLKSVDKVKINAAMIKGTKLVEGNKQEETCVYVYFLKELESIFEPALNKISIGYSDEESD